MAAIVGVLSAGVLAGVVIGVALSLVLADLRRDDARRCRCSGARPGPRCSATSTRTPTTRRSRGSSVLRLDGGLFFATAEALEERIRGLTEATRRRSAIVLDLEGVDFIDSQGAAKLAEIHELARADGVTLRLARVKPQRAARCCDADGLVELIGADHIHGNVDRAISAQLSSERGTAERFGRLGRVVVDNRAILTDEI